MFTKIKWKKYFKKARKVFFCFWLFIYDFYFCIEFLNNLWSFFSFLILFNAFYFYGCEGNKVSLFWVPCVSNPPKDWGQLCRWQFLASQALFNKKRQNLKRNFNVFFHENMEEFFNKTVPLFLKLSENNDRYFLYYLSLFFYWIVLTCVFFGLQKVVCSHQCNE